MAEHRVTTTEMKCKAGTEQIEAFSLVLSGVTSTCMADNIPDSMGQISSRNSQRRGDKGILRAENADTQRM